MKAKIANEQLNNESGNVADKITHIEEGINRLETSVGSESDAKSAALPKTDESEPSDKEKASIIMEQHKEDRQRLNLREQESREEQKRKLTEALENRDKNKNINV